MSARSSLDGVVLKKDKKKVPPCWEGYERTPGATPGARGSCRPKSSAKKWDLGFDSEDTVQKDDVTDSTLASGGKLNPEQSEAPSRGVSGMAEEMTAENMSPNVTVIRHRGKRVGQINKTLAGGKEKYMVTHDEKGEHPNLFGTKAGAKVGMAEMQVGEVVKKTPLPGNPLQSDPTNTDTMEEDPTVDGLQTPQPYTDLLRLRVGGLSRLQIAQSTGSFRPTVPTNP